MTASANSAGFLNAMNGPQNKKKKFLFLFIFLLPLIILVFSLYIGPYRISPSDLFKTLISLFVPPSELNIPAVYKDIVFKIRLPRLLLALAVGASLSVSGASLQAVFRNPLVNEFILGISSGAAFGAALSLVFLGNTIPVQIAAFLFAIVAVLIVLVIAGSSDSNIVSLLLTGVIVSAFFSALLALVEYFASPYSLQSLFFWLMGSLSLATWKDLALSIPVMGVGVIFLILFRWRLNILSMGEDEARALGINIRKEKILVILATALTTAAATSVAGIVGWIGLIVPHLVRMMAWVDNRKVIPLSAALGASFLLIADDITRGIAAFEIPIGIFTSIIGIPLFIFLLKRTEKVWL